MLLLMLQLLVSAGEGWRLRASLLLFLCNGVAMENNIRKEKLSLLLTSQDTKAPRT